MISLVEGASRKKTPNEIALNILLISLTVIFLIVVVTLYCFADYSGVEIPVATLIAFACLPDPDYDRGIAFGNRYCGNGPCNKI